MDDARFADIFLARGNVWAYLPGHLPERDERFTTELPRIAPQIVQRGVPAVVAMQYDVRFSVAKVFLEEFYKAVAARKPVDWAVQWATRPDLAGGGPRPA